jgi:hypothetical protein
MWKNFSPPLSVVVRQIIWVFIEIETSIQIHNHCHCHCTLLMGIFLREKEITNKYFLNFAAFFFFFKLLLLASYKINKINYVLNTEIIFYSL